MGTARRLLLALAVMTPPAMMLAGGPAAAQMAWPGDPQPQNGGPAWPGERPAAPQGGMSPMMGGPMMGSPRPMSPGMGGGGGGPPPCMAEFAKLREEVEKKGLAAKAAGQKHVSREEMCKLISSYAASEAKWVKFTESGVASCGIPAQIAGQLKQVHTNTEQTREKICAAGPAGPAAAPSLSEALGTTKLTPDSSKTAGSGVFDTMTGSAVRP